MLLFCLYNFDAYAVQCYSNGGQVCGQVCAHTLLLQIFHRHLHDLKAVTVHYTHYSCSYATSSLFLPVFTVI